MMSQVVKTATLEKIRFAINIDIAEDFGGAAATVTQEIDDKIGFICDTVVYQLRTHLIGLADEKHVLSVSHPNGWFQMFKDQYFPLWALEKWPVKHTTTTTSCKVFKTVCPHVQLDDHLLHLKYVGGFE